MEINAGRGGGSRGAKNREEAAPSPSDRGLEGHIPSEHGATLWESPLARPDAWSRATVLRRSGRVLCPGQMPGPGQRMLRVLWVPRELPLSRDSGPFLGRNPLAAKRLPADGTSVLRRSGRVLCPGQMPGAGQRMLWVPRELPLPRGFRPFYGRNPLVNQEVTCRRHLGATTLWESPLGALPTHITLICGRRPDLRDQ